MMNIVILGLPGVGKGTQAKMIAERYSLCVVCPGDMLRKVVRDGGGQAEYVSSLLNKGQLVGDDYVMSLVEECFVERGKKCNGFLFDGVPRNLSQAETLGDMLVRFGSLNNGGDGLVAVIHLVANESVLIDRMTSRVVCSKCGAVYNKVTNFTRIEGVCDICGGNDLTGRCDDDMDIIKYRIATAREVIINLVEYYKSGNVSVVEVDADATVDVVFRNIITVLDKICADYV